MNRIILFCNDNSVASAVLFVATSGHCKSTAKDRTGFESTCDIATAPIVPWTKVATVRKSDHHHNINKESWHPTNSNIFCGKFIALFCWLNIRIFSTKSEIYNPSNNRMDLGKQYVGICRASFILIAHITVHACYRGHFGSRYKSGCCDHASLFTIPVWGRGLRNGN